MSDRDERLRWLCGLLLYSIEPLERAEIGGLLSIFDRRSVSRYIRETRDLGWVRFSFWPPREPGLTEALTEALGLRATVVSGPVRRLRDGEEAPASGDQAPAEGDQPAANLGDPLKRVLGGAAAHVFVERLCEVMSRGGDGVQVGVSGGETLYHLIEALHSSRGLPDTSLRVIPVSRGLPPRRNSLSLSGGELASLLVDHVNKGATARHRATLHHLPFLRFVPDPAEGDAGARDVTGDLETGLRGRYEQLDVVLAGIGGTDSRTVESIARDLGVDTRPDNLVGEIFGLPLDREVAEKAPERVRQTGIGYAELDLLRARGEQAASEGGTGPHIVAVAGGPTKLLAILSAAGFRRVGASFQRTAAPLITELVTDRDTAEVLLETLAVSSNGGPPDREAQRHWVAGYLSLIHPQGLTHDQIREELVERELTDKQGETSGRLEAAALVRASVAMPGRGRGERTPIMIHTTAPPSARYEVALTHLLRIDVRVSPGEGPERVADVASDYFSEALAERRQELDKFGRDLPEGERPPVLRIGIAGGKHLKAFVDRWPGADFTSTSDPKVEIYPFVYKVPEESPSDTRLADLLTRRLRGSRAYEILRDHPLDESQREAILQIPYVRRYLEAVRSVDFALLGIGSFPEGERDGAYAHVCWRNIAHDGRALPIVGPRPVGVRLEHLSQMFLDAEVERWRRARKPVSELRQVRSLHRLVAVASGTEKLDALKAVLSRNLRHVRARPGEAKSDHERLYRREEGFEPDVVMAPFLNVLIVDEPLAKALVQSLGTWPPLTFD